MAARGARTATLNVCAVLACSQLVLQRERPTGLKRASACLPAGAAAIGLDSRTERPRSTIAGLPAIWTDARKYAAELVALAPDVIFASGKTAEPRADAAGNSHHTDRICPYPRPGRLRDLSTALARPGGNATGFAAFDYGLGAKWLQLLKELAPNVTRVGCHSRSCYCFRAWLVGPPSSVSFAPSTRYRGQSH